MVDADFAKKIETDAVMTKAAKQVTVLHADVFMGRFDDTKYEVRNARVSLQPVRKPDAERYGHG